MKSIIIFSLLGICAGQRGFRTFPARFRECDGPAKGILNIRNVTISAPLALKENCRNRHLLVKGRRVQICVEGTIPTNSPFPLTGSAGLKNSAHGTLPALPPQDFCDVEKNGCKNTNPQCGQLKSGENVKVCSILTVPNDPILLNPLVQPDVTVRWRTLYESSFDSSVCEKNYETQPGQVPFICMDLDTKVVNQPKCPRPLLG